VKLAVINGSPHGKNGNTNIMLDNFISGFKENEGNFYSIDYLMNNKDLVALTKSLGEADIVLIAYPLYTDCMPGIVKEFIEALQDFRFKKNNPAICFLIQCGFPETKQLRAVERYHIKLAKRLNFNYKGTIAKGGGEGLKQMPARLTRKLYNNLFEIGKIFGNTGELNAMLLKKIAGKEKYGKISLFFARFLLMILNRIIWNKELKKNNAFNMSYDRPYEEKKSK